MNLTNYQDVMQFIGNCFQSFFSTIMSINIINTTLGSLVIFMATLGLVGGIIWKIVK